MVQPRRRLSGWALGVLLLLTPAAFADNADLKRARELFQQHDYRAAQELLLKIQEANLNDDEKAERAQLLQIIPKAIDASQRAAREKVEADTAYNAGKWNEASRLYESIVANEFAPPELRSAARQRLDELSKRQQFAVAAQPSGPVRNQQPSGGQPMQQMQPVSSPPATPGAAPQRRELPPPTQGPGGQPMT
ncbi:MAG: hypothetical protein D6744_17170, partial [Planctomycetota bacterium]